jgi:DNA-directed RNA polymerase sigma subunit (sigma70/sigma32)
MSEKNMTEKLADSITKLIKKTNTFEKVETLLKGVSLFMFITGAVTLYNSYKLHKMTSHLNLSKNNMEDRINTKLDKIIETNEKIISLIENNIQLQKPNYTDVSCCEVVDIIEDTTNVSEVEYYYDFLNECYDNIPCNNSKKATGLNRLFGWK